MSFLLLAQALGACTDTSDNAASNSAGQAGLGGRAEGTAGLSAAGSAGATSGTPESSGAPSTAGTGVGGMAPVGGSSGEGGAPGLVKGDCSSTHLQGCYRGLYLSLWSDRLGQLVFEGDTEQHREILGDALKEQAVLAFIEAERIESLSLYNLKTILADDLLEPALLSFLARARQRGVLEVNAICDTTESAWDAIAAVQATSQPFDGLATEIEFWNGGSTFQEFRDTLSYVRALDIQARSGGPALLGAYVGWPDAAQLDALLPLIHRLYVHVYVKAAEQAYAYGQARFQLVAEANQKLATNVEVWPIFSAEGATWAAASEHFMGEWLGAHSLDEAETQLLGDWEAAPPTGAVSITGIQYYEYFFLARYLQ